MAICSESRIEALFAIMDVDLDDVLIDLYEENKIPFVLLTYGYGTAGSEIYEMLGYGGPKKIVAISIHTDKVSDFIMNRLHDEIDLGRPGTGVVFTVSLSSMNRVLAEICSEACENLKIGSESMSVTSKEPYQLIIAVVDSGYFGQVMEAAKAAGASGGTLIHARSLGSKEAEKYLGITLQPEKELVLILAPQEKRHAIMESITAETGLNTEARGSCFSLPVNSVMGVDATIENFNDL
jgi:nitrogen regulatory protein PII